MAKGACTSAHTLCCPQHTQCWRGWRGGAQRGCCENPAMGPFTVTQERKRRLPVCRGRASNGLPTASLPTPALPPPSSCPPQCAACTLPVESRDMATRTYMHLFGSDKCIYLLERYSSIVLESATSYVCAGDVSCASEGEGRDGGREGGREEEEGRVGRREQKCDEYAPDTSKGSGPEF